MFGAVSIFLGCAGLVSANSGPVRPAVTDRRQLPWRELGSDSIRELPNSRVEAQLRLELIRRARRTIDISQYVQTADESVAMPVMSALRDAANRGVKVRFMTNYFPSIPFDATLSAPKYLTGTPTRVPIDYLLFGVQKNWFVMDSIHEKLLIVDDEWAVTGGRAYGEAFMTWLDDGFIVKGKLAADSRALFDRIWRFAASQHPLVSSKAIVEDAPLPAFKHYEPPLWMTPSKEGVQEVAALGNWLQSEETGPSAGRGRAIHHDLLQQLWMNRFPQAVQERIAALHDPILQAVLERVRLPETSEIAISSMSVIEHPEFKQALIEAAERGARVEIVTNSEHSNGSVAPLSLNWKYALPDMVDLLRAGVVIHAFDSDPARYNWKYLHKKIAIVDDHVFFGSHNFHLPSTLFNDEVDFEVESASFARRARARLQFEITTATRSVDLLETEWQLNARGGFLGIEDWLGSLMFPVF